MQRTYARPLTRAIQRMPTYDHVGLGEDLGSLQQRHARHRPVRPGARVRHYGVRRVHELVCACAYMFLCKCVCVLGQLA